MHCWDIPCTLEDSKSTVKDPKWRHKVDTLLAQGLYSHFVFFVNPCVCFTVTNSDYQPVILPMFLKMVQIFDMDHVLF